MAFNKDEVDYHERQAKNHPDPATRASCEAALNAIRRAPVKEEARLDAEEARRQADEARKSAQAEREALANRVTIVAQVLVAIAGFVSLLIALTDGSKFDLTNGRVQFGASALGISFTGGYIKGIVRKLSGGKSDA